jgi:Protein of unknown function (DUF2934)
MAEAYQHEEITKLAYELWERRGRPVGSPDIDWYAAEGALGSVGFATTFFARERPHGPEEGP